MIIDTGRKLLIDFIHDETSKLKFMLESCEDDIID